jgi:LTXXQ motif family protein
MRKPLFILATVAMLGALVAAPAFAQKAKSDRPTANQIVAFDDARVAKLKADLRLTSEQESGWGKLESSLKDLSKRRADRMVARWEKDDAADARNPPTPGERMRRAADALRAQADELIAAADAIDPLWGKLDDRQKRTLSAYLDQSFGQRR